MNTQSKQWLLALGFLCLGIVLGALIPGRYRPMFGSSQEIVRIEVSGGWHIEPDPNKILGAIHVYDDGSVVREMIGGENKLLRVISPSEVAELHRLINAEDAFSGFVKKERRFCDSSVDGIDTNMIFPGTNPPHSFSTCNFRIESSPLTDYIPLLTDYVRGI